MSASIEYSSLSCNQGPNFNSDQKNDQKLHRSVSLVRNKRAHKKKLSFERIQKSDIKKKFKEMSDTEARIMFNKQRFADLNLKS